jgi:hypothetical protein
LKPPARAARVWVAWLIGAAFAAALVWSTFQQSGVECEACVDFHGASACSRVAASNSDEAARQAQASACASLSRGVTEGLECDRTPPRSLSCSEP